MTITQKGLLILLKSAITGERLPLPEGFRLEDADEMIRKQSLLPLAFQGAYNCGISPKTELMQQYQKQYYRILFRSQRQMAAVKQIFQAFEENDIDFVPLKGCNMKLLYPQPELRTMGDADILIRVEQYERIKPLMQSLGFAEEKENSHELNWSREDLHVELHKCLIPPENKEFYSYFADGWSLAMPQKGTRYAFTPEDEFIFNFVHMTKHYRARGIGSRHFLDLYVFRRANPKLNDDAICKKMEKLHLLEFYQNTLHLLENWFEGTPSNEKTEAMTQFIFSGGIWGDNKLIQVTQELKKASGNKAIKNTKASMAWELLFPPISKLQYQYRILIKHPYLYPLVWIYRAFRLIVARRDNIRKKLGTLHELTDEKVLARREELRFVGLDFYDE